MLEFATDGKTSGYILIIVGLFIIIRLWFRDLESLATYLGLLSAGIAYDFIFQTYPDCIYPC